MLGEDVVTDWEKLLLPVLEKVAPLVNDGGIIVCETDANTEPPSRLDRFSVAKTYRFGHTFVWLYRYDPVEEGDQ